MCGTAAQPGAGLGKTTRSRDQSRDRSENVRIWGRSWVVWSSEFKASGGGFRPQGVVWSSEDARRASTPTTDCESRCTSDDQRGRPRASTLNDSSKTKGVA
eukprot:237919-Pyramimonas_sp.AAC.1